VRRTDRVVVFADLPACLVCCQETIAQVAGLLTDALQDPTLKAALAKLVADLCVDPDVQAMATELTLKVMDQPEVVTATNKLLMASTSTVLANEEIIAQSKGFVADVMGDDTLQKEGGDALWNSVTHALKPGLIRCVLRDVFSSSSPVVSLTFIFLSLRSFPQHFRGWSRGFLRVSREGAVESILKAVQWGGCRHSCFRLLFRCILHFHILFIFIIKRFFPTMNTYTTVINSSWLSAHKAKPFQ